MALQRTHYTFSEYFKKMTLIQGLLQRHEGLGCGHCKEHKELADSFEGFRLAHPCSTLTCWIRYRIPDPYASLNQFGFFFRMSHMPLAISSPFFFSRSCSVKNLSTTFHRLSFRTTYRKTKVSCSVWKTSGVPSTIRP